MVSKKELEEKRRKEEEDAAHVFEEFIETFQQPTDKSIISKVWVKSGIFNGREDIQAESSVYKPSTRFKCGDAKSSIEQAQECARLLFVDRKKNDSSTRKKKSNLESFKEELEQIHKDREERQKAKNELAQIILPETEIPSNSDQNDPMSTNLYVNNLNPKITEYVLMELFGTYGPLASVKIMWPRSEEDKNRSKNYCGFVAFMSRKDAERAMRNLDNKKFMDCELKVGWGKPVLIPPYPIYIPPALLELSHPPPNTGLPFNAQPLINNDFVDLKNSIIKVTIPTNRNILMLIHRMIEFVIREGLLFEAIMMTREMTNPLFRFLFDNQSSAHIYYRWKLFSILQGDSQKQWNTKEFRMFHDGPIWQPPKIIDYTQGMPNHLIESPQKSLAALRKTLSTTQRDNLEFIIHKLTPEKKKVAEAMIYCIEHSEAADEIVECILQSLQTNSRSIKKIISRLYLLNDILYNSQTLTIAKPYFKLIESQITSIISSLQRFNDATEKTREKQLFFLKICKVFSAWSTWKVLPPAEIDNIYKIFMNIDTQNSKQQPYEEKIENSCRQQKEKKCSENKLKTKSVDKILSGFAPSRWEIIDPEVIESQAMTTSKWSEYMGENLEKEENSKNKREISEEKRKKLREIELIVMQYQDSLELENIRTRSDIMEKVEEYRTKLIKEYEKEEKYHHKRHKKKRRSPSRSPKRKYSRHC